MPTRSPTLDAGSARDHIGHLALTAACDGDVGLELEWLTTRHHPAEGQRPPLATLERIAGAVSPTGHRSAVTIEPGGQLELSTRPLPDAAWACATLADDLYTLEQACRRHDVELVALGADPIRAPERLVTESRYRAMQAAFDASGADGRSMMTNSASLQVNIGLGDDRARVRRWRVAHLLGPVLLASFANSPFADRRPTGWRSTRMRWWNQIDPTRSAPVGGEEPERWIDYALAAQVLYIRAGDEAVAVTEPLPFATWLAEGHDLGHPSHDDLAEHLTTLFPPIRPRGWLEIRMIDSLPTPWWHVAVAVLCHLLDAEDATGEIEEACAPVADRWTEAARSALADPALAEAAGAVFEVAVSLLARDGTDDAVVAVTEAYRRRYVDRRRCPADDRLDAWRATGELLPPAESPLPMAAVEEAFA